MNEPEQPKRRNVSKRPGAMDHTIGSRLRMWRRTMGVDSYALAAKIGITYQQLQKYEKGLNRISAARLYVISQALNIPIDYFYRDAEAQAVGESGNDDRRHVLERGGTELLKCYIAIRDPDVRKAVLNLMRSIAADERDGAAIVTSNGIIE